MQTPHTIIRIPLSLHAIYLSQFFCCCLFVFHFPVEIQFFIGYKFFLAKRNQIHTDAFSSMLSYMANPGNKQ
jgi:hypothetical protein